MPDIENQPMEPIEPNPDDERSMEQSPMPEGYADSMIEDDDDKPVGENTPGRGWHGESERHAEVGRKGGETVSKNREHMAAIGRKGGATVSQNREHMAEIGRKGGAAVSENRNHMAAIGRKGGLRGRGGQRTHSQPPANAER